MLSDLRVISGVRGGLTNAAVSLAAAAVLVGCAGAAPQGASSASASEATKTAKADREVSSTSPKTHRAPKAGEDTKANAAFAQGAAAESEPFELIPQRAANGSGKGRPPSVAPIPLRLSSLPVASLRTPLRESDGNRAAFAAGTPASDLVVRVTDRPARSDYMQAVVAAPNAAFSEIRVGTWVGWGGGPYARDAGPFITCSRQYSSFLPAHWETLEIKGGNAELTVTDGWFDQSACKASIVSRTTVKAPPLFGAPLVFAFRACGATCGEREDLVVIFPRAQSVVSSAVGGDAPRGVGSFTTVTLPIRRGGGGSMMAKIPAFEIQSFKKSAGIEAAPEGSAKGAAPKPALIEVVFGVEVSQSIEDPEPFAIAYVGPEGALELTATLGAGHPDLGLSPSDGQAGTFPSNAAPRLGF